MASRPKYLRHLDYARDCLARGALYVARLWIASGRRIHALTARSSYASLRPQYRRCTDGRWAPALALNGVIFALGRGRYAHRQSAQRRAVRMLGEVLP